MNTENTIVNQLKTKTFTRKNVRKANIYQLVFAFLFLILINIIGAYLFFRLDLTAEKRYTLSKSTRDMLKNLDDVVYFKIYLDGDFPASFKRLQKETKEILNEFRAYSDNVQYEFINPSEGKDKRETGMLYNQLKKKGIEPTQLQNRTADGVDTKVIFPGAIVTYKQRELPLQLLMSNINLQQEEVINTSIQSLEYNIASVIRKLKIEKKPRVAFIEGHGELNQDQVFSITQDLSAFYEVERLKIDGQINCLRNFALDSVTGKAAIWNKFDAIIIAKPDSTFSNKDKFIIDQYVMRGGNILWLVDPVFAAMDSMYVKGETISIVNDLNLNDMFFRYGVRMNTNLLQDLNAVPIPIMTGKMGNQPQMQLIPWFYFPIITPVSENPIVKNLNSLKTEFISSIDTVGDPSIQKTVLLSTSRYTKMVNAPSIISLNILKRQPDKREFGLNNVPVAVLCEGNFTSLYKDRLDADMDTSSMISFVEKCSKPSRMIFVADGDIIKNQFSKQGPLPLGYDKYNQMNFGNKDFIMNSLNYLCNDESLMQVRARDVKIRLLDTTKILRDKFYWQMFNIATPLVIIILMGGVLMYIRKRKYSN
ncbi:MAG: gliding motility-associated ABC transporter substrate-binding protein GldG [Bacteroidota bacterium]